MKLTRLMICSFAISGMMFGCGGDSSDDSADDCTLNGSCAHEIDQKCGNTICNIQTVTHSTSVVCNINECQASSCEPGFHLYIGQCEADSLDNCGMHKAVCDTSEVKNSFAVNCLEGQCVATACNDGYVLNHGKCESNTPENSQLCGMLPCNIHTIEHSTDVKCYENQCQAILCIEGYHLYNGQCEADSLKNCGKHNLSCSNIDISHSSEVNCIHGECLAIGCQDGFELKSGKCKAIQSTDCSVDNSLCTTDDIDNSTKVKCEEGVCKATECKAGYHLYQDECEADSLDNCGMHKAVCNISKVKDSSAVNCLEGQCVATACNDGYDLNNGKCESNTSEDSLLCGMLPCNIHTIENSTDVKCYDNQCQAISCIDDYHLYDGQCEADSLKNCGKHDLSCSTEDINYSSEVNCIHGECLATACQDGFELKSGKCKAVQPPDCSVDSSLCTTDDIDNSTKVKCEKGVCKATECRAGYHLYQDECEADDEVNCGEHSAACDTVSMENSRIVACELGVCKVSACMTGYHLNENHCDEDAVISIDNKKIAGVSQKGPFIIGSTVTVQELNGSTLEQTGKSFKGKTQNSKGEFSIASVSLASQYAMIEVNGYYRNEFTGQNSSSPITLNALVDLSDRDNVNINILTHFETERVMQLVNVDGMGFDEAKTKSRHEILAAFGITGDYGAVEDMNIFGQDDNSAILLAISIIVQGNLEESDFLERVNEISVDFMDGVIDNVDIYKQMALWTYNANFDEIRQNVESWESNVPDFEKYVVMFRNWVFGGCDTEGALQLIGAESKVKVCSQSEGSCNTDPNGWSFENSLLVVCHDGHWGNLDQVGSINFIQSIPEYNKDHLDEWIGPCDENKKIAVSDIVGDRNYYCIYSFFSHVSPFSIDSLSSVNAYSYFMCDENGWTGISKLDYLFGFCEESRIGEVVMEICEDVNYCYSDWCHDYNSYYVCDTDGWKKTSRFIYDNGICDESKIGVVAKNDCGSTCESSYCTCNGNSWKASTSEEIMTAEFERFGVCNESNYGEIRYSDSLGWEYACGEDGWHMATQDEIYSYEFGTCEVIGEKKHSSRFYSNIDLYKNQMVVCTESGWLRANEIDDLCVTDWDVRTCGAIWYGVWWDYTDWFWVCLNGEWQIMNIKDLEGHL